MVCLHSNRITVTIMCRIYLGSITRTQEFILSHSIRTEPPPGLYQNHPKVVDRWYCFHFKERSRTLEGVTDLARVTWLIIIKEESQILSLWLGDPSRMTELHEEGQRLWKAKQGRSGVEIVMFRVSLAADQVWHTPLCGACRFCGLVSAAMSAF